MRRNGAGEEVGKYDLGNSISWTGNRLVWLGKKSKSWEAGPNFFCCKSEAKKVTKRTNKGRKVGFIG